MIKRYEKDKKLYYEVYVAERDADKKLIARRKRGIRSEREAKEVEFRFKAELRDKVSDVPILRWQALHQNFIDRYQHIYRKSTMLNYDSYLKKYIPEDWHSKPIDQITSGDVSKVIDMSRNKLGPTSQKNILKLLNKIFQTAIEDGALARNPCHGIRLRTTHTQKKVLTSKEVEILLREAKLAGHEFYPIWTFAVKTGMRSGEMYALQWSDIDFDSNLISVNKQWTSKDGTHELKTGDWRLVPVSSDLKVMLLQMKIGKPSTDFVLPRPWQWTKGCQAAVLKDFCGLCGITKVKFHDLRATFITNLLSQGVALVRVMSIAGHKKMETTDEYLRLAGVDVRGATESLAYGVPTEVQSENVLTVNFSR